MKRIALEPSDGSFNNKHLKLDSDEFRVKEEPLDSFEVKTEPIDEDFPQFSSDNSLLRFEVKQEQPCSSTEKEVDNITWRPCFESMMNEDFGEIDDELELGNSILFRQNPFVEERREEEPEDSAEEELDKEEEAPRSKKKKTQLVAYKMRGLIGRLYLKNRHPSIEYLIRVAEEHSLSYRALFEHYERRREYEDVKCAPNDACCRIKRFFLRENEPAPRYVNWKLQKLLHGEIEKQIKSNKRFSLGYVHLIVDKTGLPPGYVRSQYSLWRNRLLQGRNKSISEWKLSAEGRIDDIPLATIKLLEAAYLDRKYSFGAGKDEKWSPEELKQLSQKLNGLSEHKISTWLKKRALAASGMPEAPVEPPVVVPVRQVILPRQREMMEEELRRLTDPPTAQFLRDLEKKVKLCAQTIRSYWFRMQRSAKRDVEWERARQDVMKMPKEKVRLMEEVAKEPRLTVRVRRERAKKIGVSAQTLSSFIDWKKALNNQQRRQIY